MHGLKASALLKHSDQVFSICMQAHELANKSIKLRFLFNILYKYQLLHNWPYSLTAGSSKERSETAASLTWIESCLRQISRPPLGMTLENLYWWAKRGRNCFLISLASVLFQAIGLEFLFVHRTRVTSLVLGYPTSDWMVKVTHQQLENYPWQVKKGHIIFPPTHHMLP